MRLSIVIPVYNSEQALDELVTQLKAELSAYEFEIVFVNDSSRDGSIRVLRQLAQKNANITVLDLARNFGQHNAIMAGLRQVRGDIVVLMDDDLQHPPSEVHKLIEPLLKDACDVVFGNYRVKKHNWFRNLGSKFNDRLASVIIQKYLFLLLSSFYSRMCFVFE